MKKIVSFEKVSKKYPSLNYKTLEEVTLHVREKEIYGIIGESGSGKSTLLRCLLGLETPSGGKIYFKNQEIYPKTFPDIRQEIGVVFQHCNLFFSKTVEENIAFPLEIKGSLSSKKVYQRVQELLEMVNLTHKRKRYPQQLSGGERQRVAIARALVYNPSLLLCDEATSSLDPRTTKTILDLLKNLNQTFGITLIIVTHEREVMKQTCHRIAVLEQGRIVEEGRLVDLFSFPKHRTTKQFLKMEPSFHSFIKKDINKELLRLCFQGETAKTPSIAHLMKTYDVEINILSGDIEYLPSLELGSLVIELSGPLKEREKVRAFFQKKNIGYEEMHTCSS